MKLRKLKSLPLAIVSALTLSSCTLLDNVINGMLVNTLMNVPILMNYVDLMQLINTEGTGEGSEDSLPLKQFATQPTSTSKRAEINYFINPLLVPEEVSINGINYAVNVELEYSGEGADAHSFKEISIDVMSLLGDATSDIPVSLRAKLIFPVGESSFLDDVETLDDLMAKVENPMDILNETKQEAKNVSITLKVSAGNKMRQRTYHFGLIKPDFGRLVIDQVFASGIVFNMFDAKTQDITTISDNLTDEANPYPVEYLKQTLAIPHKFEIDGVGEVTIDATPSNPEVYFQSSITKNISEIAPDNGMIVGDVTVSTFTPIGEYVVPNTVTTIDDFKDHLETADKKELYRHATGEERFTTFNLKVTSGEEEGEEDYYFRLKRAPFEEEILDFVMDTDYIINKLNYKDINSNALSEDNRITPPTSSETALDIHYLVDALVIPHSLVIEDLGDAELSFDVDIRNGDDSLFYRGTQNVSIDEAGVRDLVVNTFTPIGEGADAIVPTTPEGNILAFADELTALETKALYRHATKPAAINGLEIDVTASMMTSEGPKTKTKTYFFNLKPADVDQDIVDTVINDFNVLNTADFTFNITPVDNSSKDASTPKLLTYFFDTLVIPKEVTLKDYDNRLLQFEIEYDDPTNLFYPAITTKQFKVEKDQVDPDEVELYSLTPVGTHPTDGGGHVEPLLINFGTMYVLDNAALEASYNSQVNNQSFSITVTVTLNGKTASATYYLLVNNSTPFANL